MGMIALCSFSAGSAHVVGCGVDRDNVKWLSMLQSDGTINAHSNLSFNTITSLYNLIHNNQLNQRE
jgi:hypothetical protein